MESWRQTLTELAVGRGAALKRHAFLLCGDDSRAEDLAQEALVRAFSRPLRAPRPGAAEAYVRVTMTNLFIDGARRHTRWTRAAPLLRTPAAAAGPADQVAARDAMLTALSGLSPVRGAALLPGPAGGGGRGGAGRGRRDCQAVPQRGNAQAGCAAVRCRLRANGKDQADDYR